MTNEILHLQRIPKIYAYTETQYAKTEWEGSRKGKGLLKVGYTERSVPERIAEQFPTNKPSVDYRILLDEFAIRESCTICDGDSFFGDHEVHKELENIGAKRFPNSEWFECTVQEVQAAIEAVKTSTHLQPARLKSFKMRPEQAEAVKMTSAYFTKNSRDANGKTPHFLWNAKMRFGKTFATYKLAQKMGWKRILVLTFKPAVQAAWQEDIETHSDFEGWQFVHRDGLQFGDTDKSKPIVWFASFQDVLGKKELGGIKAHNEDIHATDWDCVVLDEYHFGAWRENARGLFDSENESELDELDEIKNSGLDYFSEELMPITTRGYLYLSGTPFRALTNGEFLEDQIFNWTYSDEQREKENWSGSAPNPYLELPQMVLMTYQMPDEIRKVALKGETNQFDLNEFFKAEAVAGGGFKHEEAVQKWLNIIRGQHFPTEENNLRQGSAPPMPYSDARLLSATHSLWFMPSVASCHAMKKLLSSRANSFFKEYKILVAAGIEAGIGIDALYPVQEAIGNGFHTKTITLTCGKLTTGVSVPPWGAIFMLRNTSSPETYFQSAFRIQTPWTLRNPDGLSPNKIEIIKTQCFVYDFAPDRALTQIADYSSRLDINSKEKPEKKVEEFIHFLPVLCYDGSTMRKLNAEQILDVVVSGTASTMLARRWESALLVNVDNETLGKIKNNPDVLEALQKIEGFRGLNKQITTILNKSNALTRIKKEDPEEHDREQKREVSAEEKEIKSLRKQIQEKLLKFATRIPVFMYLTDHREHTLKDVISLLEPELFRKVTGLDKADFSLLVSVGVFNSALMNSAVFAFKRYEDASLTYTGIVKQDTTTLGGWDTTATIEEIKQVIKL